MIQISIKIPAKCPFNSSCFCHIPQNDETVLDCDATRQTFPKDCPLRKDKIILHTPFDRDQK